MQCNVNQNPGPTIILIIWCYNVVIIKPQVQWSSALGDIRDLSDSFTQQAGPYPPQVHQNRSTVSTGKQ